MQRKKLVPGKLYHIQINSRDHVGLLVSMEGHRAHRTSVASKTHVTFQIVTWGDGEAQTSWCFERFGAPEGAVPRSILCRNYEAASSDDPDWYLEKPDLCNVALPQIHQEYTSEVAARFAEGYALADERRVKLDRARAACEAIRPALREALVSALGLPDETDLPKHERILLAQGSSGKLYVTLRLDPDSAVLAVGLLNRLLDGAAEVSDEA